MEASNLRRRDFLKTAGLFASALSFSGCTNPPSGTSVMTPGGSGSAGGLGDTRTRLMTSPPKRTGCQRLPPAESGSS